MSKKVLILSGSSRIGEHSDLLCDEFMKGAIESGNQVEKINVSKKKIDYCKGCYYCQTHNGECAIKDDMAEVLQKMLDADVLVLASPVYFLSINAQLEALIDRNVARWTEVKNKDFYYIVTCAEVEWKTRVDRTIECFRGYADCVNGAIECGIIYGHSVYKIDKLAMKEAYEMGKGIK